MVDEAAFRLLTVVAIYRDFNDWFSTIGDVLHAAMPVDVVIEFKSKLYIRQSPLRKPIMRLVI